MRDELGGLSMFALMRLFCAAPAPQDLQNDSTGLQNAPPPKLPQSDPEPPLHLRNHVPTLGGEHLPMFLHVSAPKGFFGCEKITLQTSKS